jgi:RHS repeat-associated protein
MRSVIEVQTWFTAWDGWSEAQEMILGVDGANVVVKPQRQFVWGEQLDELVSYRYRQPGTSTWAEYFVAEGGAHCPSRVLNDAGVVVEVQEYDAYGKASFYNGSGTYVGGYTQNSVGNPFQWKGHRVDPETGLTYMRNRYYASAWGRFLTQDPLGVWGDRASRGNGYSFGVENPLTNGDPLGLQVTAYLGGAGDQGFPLNTGQIDRARDRHEGSVGDNETFGWSESDKAADWIEVKYRRQEEQRRQQTPIGPLLPIPVVVIGHSWGGAKAKDVSDKLACRGIRVTHLVTLDPVSEGFVASPTNVDKWVNVHQESGFADYVASVPLLGPALLVGGPLGWIALWTDSGDLSDTVGTIGGQLGAEDGATNIATDKPHWDAAGYLELAIPQLKDLVNMRVLRW